MTGRTPHRRYLPLTALLALTGCAGVVDIADFGTQDSAIFQDAGSWLNRARHYVDEGDLAAALRHLRIAQTLDPGDKRIAVEIEQTESRIRLLVSRYLSEGGEARKLGRVEHARKAYLRVLSLQPGQPDALSELRRFEQFSDERWMAATTSRSRQLALEYDQSKIESEEGREAAVYVGQSAPQPEKTGTGGLLDYRQRLERRIENDPGDRGARQLLVHMLLERAGKAFTLERFDQALKFLVEGESIASGETSLQQPIGNSREEYGRTLYSMGLRVYRDDINRAIGYWEYALKFDPENEKSRLRLKSARSR